MFCKNSLRTFFIPKDAKMKASSDTRIMHDFWSCEQCPHHNFVGQNQGEGVDFLRGIRFTNIWYCVIYVSYKCSDQNLQKFKYSFKLGIPRHMQLAAIFIFKFLADFKAQFKRILAFLSFLTHSGHNKHRGVIHYVRTYVLLSQTTL